MTDPVLASSVATGWGAAPAASPDRSPASAPVPDAWLELDAGLHPECQMVSTVLTPDVHALGATLDTPVLGHGDGMQLGTVEALVTAAGGALVYAVIAPATGPAGGATPVPLEVLRWNGDHHVYGSDAKLLAARVGIAAAAPPAAAGASAAPPVARLPAIVSVAALGRLHLRFGVYEMPADQWSWVQRR